MSLPKYGLKIRFSRQQLVLLVACVLIVLLQAYYLQKYLSLDFIHKYRFSIAAFVKDHYVLAVCIFSLIYSLAVSLSVPAAPLTLLGGFLFGFVPGVIIALVSATLGGCLGFLFVRYVVGRRFQRKYSQQLTTFNKEINRNGFYYLLGLRLTFVVPFFLINILAGLTKVPLTHFVLATFIGIIPATIAYTYAGQHLQDITSIKDIFNRRLVLIFLLLAILALVPILLKLKTSRLQSPHRSD